MSGEIEFDKCDFCHQEKLVHRTIVRTSDYVEPKEALEYLMHLADGDYFTIIRTCSDCGVPKN